jgi:hypothetical protein
MNFKKFAVPLLAAAAFAVLGSSAVAAQPHVVKNGFTTGLAAACKKLPAFPTGADTAKTVAALKKTAPALQKELDSLKSFYNADLPKPPASILKTAEGLNTDVGHFIKIFGQEVVAVRAGNLTKLAKLRKQVAVIAPRMEKEFKAVGVPGCL